MVEESETIDEEKLLSGLRAGDEAAFEQLIRTYGGRMRATALRLVKNEANADDVVQEAFLSALRSLESFEGRSRIGTWLHRITINAALMKLRSQRRSKEATLGDLLPRFSPSGAFAEPVSPASDLPEEPAAKQELCQRVRDSIAELPDDYRIPLMLRDVEGMAHKEIAEALGLTVNASKLRVHRARQALRSLLEPVLLETA